MGNVRPIKPPHKSIKAYYAALAEFAQQNVDHEMAVRSAFQALLTDCGRGVKWTFIPEQAGPSTAADGRSVRPDGTFRDEYYIDRGYWEAKDSRDKLASEVKKKSARGYPLTNTIFEDTRQALLYQNGGLARQCDLTDPQQLADLLNDFFSYTEPAHEDFDKAVEDFKERVPDLAKGLVEKIQDAHKSNERFQKAFDAFYELCKSSLNPNLSAAAVDEMLVQHILTERLIRTIFDNEDFTHRNVIAAEVEKVIGALVSKSFNRKEFLKSLDRFYVAIENAARTIPSFTEKQHFLNTVYERFFQGYSVKVADTHGIVYTPQPIVDFMCASVVEVLQQEFGKTLGDKDVFILDPCTGTGNFIVNLLRRIPKKDLPKVYKERLFANEIMLLPYYIAALNIEHAYYELTKSYEPFEGLCFVDTLDIAEHAQQGFDFFTAKNSERVERQKRSPITVIVGNPPYNAWQANENDNNKNRKYAIVDSRVKMTYAKDSKAQNKNSVSDIYVKFFRWAVDRLGSDGVVCLVTNNGFVDQIAFDGMRKHLAKDFSRIYHVHLEGNVRQNPTLSGTTYNVFGIQVGVGITVAVRSRNHKSREIRFARVDKTLRREAKLTWLANNGDIDHTRWDILHPDEQNRWLRSEHIDEFSEFTSLSDRDHVPTADQTGGFVFREHSLGLKSNRDDVVYGFEQDETVAKVKFFLEHYNAEVDRFARARKRGDVEDFNYDDRIKWSETLKANVVRKRYVTFNESDLRVATYRPFAKRSLYFGPLLNERRYQMPQTFPTRRSSEQNSGIVISDLGFRADSFSALIVNQIPDLHLCATLDGHQCFPFYIYDEDGSNRRENITDWALQQFRERYGSAASAGTSRTVKAAATGSPSLSGRGSGGGSKRGTTSKRRASPTPPPPPSREGERARSPAANDAGEITKWDIFHYVYGLLHHPGYCAKFADNLKRELPRIPFADTFEDFLAFRDAGKRLAELHLKYEDLKPWDLEWVEAKGVPLSYRVEKMKLSKDKTSLKVNDSLTLGGIPPEVFEYRLGNRSALEWVIDQYQVSTDKRSGIESDPNRKDDPEYIVRLVGQVVRVSMDTVRIVNSLPASYGSGLST